MRIYPAILAHSLDEFILKVERVRQLGQFVHIDVMDGKFVDNTTWARPGEIADIMKGLPFGVHLMTEHPEEHIRDWCDAGAERVFCHVEAVDDLEKLTDIPHEGCHIGLALNPDTQAENISAYLPKVHQCLVMSVEAGWGGQEMQPTVLEKIKLIRAMNPRMEVIVDGGVNLETIAKVRDAGADAVVMGSALTDADDIPATWETLAPYRT